MVMRFVKVCVCVCVCVCVRARDSVYTHELDSSKELSGYISCDICYHHYVSALEIYSACWHVQRSVCWL